MSEYRIVILIGSLRVGSFNRALAEAVTRLNAPGYTFQRADIGALPLYSQDEDAHQHPLVQQLKGTISAADGLIFATPEYNRSVPGVLKNAIDHASRPYGQNSFAGKPAGVIGVSVGAPGASMAQQHLRNVLAYLDMPTLAQPEVFIQVTNDLFGPNGEIAKADTRKFLQEWLDRYTSWVRKFAGPR
jgi:chromate reductase